MCLDFGVGGRGNNSSLIEKEIVKGVIVLEEVYVEEQNSRRPLMLHFAKVLPSLNSNGVTARDSGGTTGDINSGEDANIDYD